MILRSLRLARPRLGRGPRAWAATAAPTAQTQRRDHVPGRRSRSSCDAGRAYPCFCTAEQLGPRAAAAQERERPLPGLSAHLPRPRHRPEAQRPASRPASPTSCRLQACPDDRGPVVVTRRRPRRRAPSTPRSSTTSSSSAPTGRPPTTSPPSSTTAAMGITHIIRGDDHLSNTPRQVLVYEALGAPRSPSSPTSP